MRIDPTLDDEHDDAISEINVTPLVDVMLVLLIVFMLTVPALTSAVRVELPAAAALPDAPADPPVTLTVDAVGAVHWDDQVVDAGELGRRLAAVSAAGRQPDVRLRGDRTVAYEHMLRVMAAVRAAGLAKLSFVYTPE